MKFENNEWTPTVTETKILGFFKEYRFLSNFHICNVEVDGIMYPSSEHAFMAMKTIVPVIREYIATLDTPGKAKKYGRTIPLRDHWDGIKVGMMYKVCFEKFYQNIDLKEALLSTGNKYLEESNYWNDNFWGSDNSTGGGLNMLGKVLMAVREDIKVCDSMPISQP